MAANIEITCPCCDTLIVIDRATGEILLHKEKVKSAKGTFEDMVAQL
jgi:hypothetical protein